jgi:hypothetical protein
MQRNSSTRAAMQIRTISLACPIVSRIREVFAE